MTLAALMRSAHSLVVLAEELGAFPLGQVPEDNLRVVRILVLGQIGGLATEVTLGPGQWGPSRQPGGTALPGAKSGGGRVLTQRPGESAKGTATTRSGRLTFEPSDSSHAQPSLAGEFFLRQAALPAQLAQSLAVENEGLRLSRAGDGRDRL